MEQAELTSNPGNFTGWHGLLPRQPPQRFCQLTQRVAQAALNLGAHNKPAPLDFNKYGVETVDTRAGHATGNQSSLRLVVIIQCVY